MNQPNEAVRLNTPPNDRIDPVREERVFIFHQTTHESGDRYADATYVVRGDGRAKSETRRAIHADVEGLLLRALSNMFKKLDFMTLTQELLSGEMTDDEYEEELSVHEDNYLVSEPTGRPTHAQAIAIVEIIDKLGRTGKMSADEVSELFSLDMENALRPGPLKID